MFFWELGDDVGNLDETPLIVHPWIHITSPLTRVALAYMLSYFELYSELIFVWVHHPAILPARPAGCDDDCRFKST